MMSDFESYRFCVAPMMDWTDRHCRRFHRILTGRALLYTEMVTTGAVLFGNKSRLLGYDPSEHPVALQLGGSDPGDMAESARAGAQWGFDEINMNVGCPSDRVKSGRFGACLMAEPSRVRDCVAAMNDAVSVPVTVKTRIGVDNQDSYQALCDFIGTVADGGCNRFIIHARKAWLSGLSPKENREIPPLSYPTVYRLKRDFPAMQIVINGGITSLEQAQNHLPFVDGVMVGRAAYQTPGLLSDVDRQFFSYSAPPIDLKAAVRNFYPYVQQQLQSGIRLSTLIRPLIGLFHGKPGAKAWRRHLSETAHQPNADIKVLEQALALLPSTDLTARASESQLDDRKPRISNRVAQGLETH